MPFGSQKCRAKLARRQSQTLHDVHHRQADGVLSPLCIVKHCVWKLCRKIRHLIRLEQAGFQVCAPTLSSGMQNLLISLCSFVRSVVNGETADIIALPLGKKIKSLKNKRVNSSTSPLDRSDHSKVRLRPSAVWQLKLCGVCNVHSKTLERKGVSHESPPYQGSPRSVTDQHGHDSLKRRGGGRRK